MIVKSYYLSDENNIERALKHTGLSIDELELIVGRFKNHSSRAGKLRGEVIILVDGSIKIRHHFSKRVIWE